MIVSDTLDILDPAERRRMRRVSEQWGPSTFLVALALANARTRDDGRAWPLWALPAVEQDRLLTIAARAVTDALHTPMVSR